MWKRLLIFISQYLTPLSDGSFHALKKKMPNGEENNSISNDKEFVKGVLHFFQSKLQLKKNQAKDDLPNQMQIKRTHLDTRKIITVDNFLKEKKCSHVYREYLEEQLFISLYEHKLYVSIISQPHLKFVFLQLPNFISLFHLFWKNKHKKLYGHV